jgi:hypothetical protein
MEVKEHNPVKIPNRFPGLINLEYDDDDSQFID